MNDLHAFQCFFVERDIPCEVTHVLQKQEHPKGAVEMIIVCGNVFYFDASGRLVYD
jgi:hypothetical protein